MKTKMKFTIIVLVALFAQNCTNKKVENDWTRDKLQGKVMSFSEFSYEAVERFGNIEKGKRVPGYHDIDIVKKVEVKHKIKYSGGIQFKYDEKGNKIEWDWYNSDGSLRSKWTYKYDEKGNMIFEENEYFFDDSLSLMNRRTYTYKYDKLGNWIKKIEFENEIPSFIVEREYEYYKF